MEDCRPEYVDRVATDFPNLQIVIQHGGWPYVHEAIGVLYKQPNVFMVPGQYVHYGFPGSTEYVEALRRAMLRSDHLWQRVPELWFAGRTPIHNLSLGAT